MVKAARLHTRVDGPSLKHSGRQTALAPGPGLLSDQSIQIEPDPQCDQPLSSPPFTFDLIRVTAPVNRLLSKGIAVSSAVCWRLSSRRRRCLAHDVLCDLNFRLKAFSLSLSLSLCLYVCI